MSKLPNEQCEDFLEVSPATQEREGGVVAAWLWRSLLLIMTLPTIATLALVGALTLGWNSPRPGGSPDWEAPGLPYRIDATGVETTVLLPARSGRDFAFEVTAAPLSPARSGFQEYGLVYRAQDAAHYYAFVIASDGYYSIIRAEGKDLIPLVAWQQFPHVTRGTEVNRLLVRCTGPTCSFRVNEEHVTTIEDDRWLVGDVGLWARTLNDHAAVEFSTARLWTQEG